MATIHSFLRCLLEGKLWKDNFRTFGVSYRSLNRLLLAHSGTEQCAMLGTRWLLPSWPRSDLKMAIVWVERISTEKFEEAFFFPKQFSTLFGLLCDFFYFPFILNLLFVPIAYNVQRCE